MIKRLIVFAAALLALLPARGKAVCIVHAGQRCVVTDADGGVLWSGGEAMAFDLGGGLFAAGVPGSYGLYGDDGARVTDAEYEMIAMIDGALIFRQDGLYGAITPEGETLAKPTWSQLVPNGHGSFLALRHTSWDERADELILLTPGADPVRTGARTTGVLAPFVEDRLRFRTPEGRYGWLDSEARVAIPAEWRGATDFADGIALVYGNAGWGALDVRGRQLLTPEYAWLARGKGLLAALAEGGRLEVFAVTRDADGEPQCALRYALEGVTQAGVAGSCVYVARGGSVQLYDVDGRCLLEVSDGARFSDGLDGQLVGDLGRWSEDGQWLVDPDGSPASQHFAQLLPLCAGRYAFRRAAPAASTGEADWGLLDSAGNELLPAEYDEILPAGDDRLALVDGPMVTLADADGRAIRTFMDDGE